MSRRKWTRRRFIFEERLFVQRRKSKSIPLAVELVAICQLSFESAVSDFSFIPMKGLLGSQRISTLKRTIMKQSFG
jgi:hypothetical protein